LGSRDPVVKLTENADLAELNLANGGPKSFYTGQ
jgi:hypothetical protein